MDLARPNGDDPQPTSTSLCARTINPATSTLTASPTPNTQTLQVDGPRLWQRLMELARIGATDKGGVCRLALSDLDGQARALFTQ